MKKNRTMRLAALLLVLTLITSCFVGGTFAKYTTVAENEDSARVANWGFTTTELELDLFDEKYGNTVQYNIANGDKPSNLIAPGAEKHVKFQIVNAEANAPEVAYKFTVDTSASVCDESIKENTNIKWYLDNKLAGTNGTWDELMTALQELAKDADGDYEYAPNKLPQNFKTDVTHEVGWEWVFSTSKDMDKKDTDMGNAAKLANVKINIKVTAEQITD